MRKSRKLDSLVGHDEKAWLWPWCKRSASLKTPDHSLSQSQVEKSDIAKYSMEAATQLLKSLNSPLAVVAEAFLSFFSSCHGVLKDRPTCPIVRLFL